MPDTVMNETTAPLPRNRSPEIDKLAAALAKAQGAMENAKKDSENPGFKRDGKNATYADLASVWSAIRKPLADNGLCVLQWPRTVQGGVEIETELMHETGQFMRDVLWLPCPQMTVHSVGSAITYGRRYALMAVVGIAPEDDDGNGASSIDREHIPGVAGGAPHFRPDGPRRFQGNGSGWVDEAKRDGILDETRNKGTMPGKPANGKAKAAVDKIELAQWCKDSIATFKTVETKDSLTTWWRENAQKREDAETAMPAEYDRLIVAFDARMDTVAAKGA